MTLQVGFLLLPGFSLLSLGAATTSLASANELAGDEPYAMRLLALDGSQVKAQCGTQIAAEPLASGLPRCHALLVVADQVLNEADLTRVRTALRPDAVTESHIAWWGGVGAGAALLASCGLLKDHRAAVHWQHAAEVGRHNLTTVISTNVYEIDRNRLTGGGGATTLDLMLTWLSDRHDAAFCAELSAQLGVERVRQSSERQPMPASAHPAAGSARITEALQLMEANLGEPLPTEEVARLVGISRRHLERLFRQHLGTLPARYYLELRLKAARRQLKQTSQSVLQIGLGCGFVSGPHFSTAYRALFGHTPREERAGTTQPREPVADN